MSVQTGEYYFNARWYDPTLGRFISEDPIRDGLNWYTAFGNNPVTRIDPTGLEGVVSAYNYQQQTNETARNGGGGGVTGITRPGETPGQIAARETGDWNNWTYMTIPGWDGDQFNMPSNAPYTFNLPDTTPQGGGGKGSPGSPSSSGEGGGGSSGTAEVETGTNDPVGPGTNTGGPGTNTGGTGTTVGSNGGIEEKNNYNFQYFRRGAEYYDDYLDFYINNPEGFIETDQVDLFILQVKLRFKDVITSDYGWRKDPYTGKSLFHRGRDIASLLSTQGIKVGVYAPFTGTVVEIAYNDWPYGNAVVIQSSITSKLISLSGHLDTISVEVGDSVYCGVSKIGTMGRSGRATGNHLHQEFQYDGMAVPYSVMNLLHENNIKYW